VTPQKDRFKRNEKYTVLGILATILPKKHDVTPKIFCQTHGTEESLCGAAQGAVNQRARAMSSTGQSRQHH